MPVDLGSAYGKIELDTSQVGTGIASAKSQVSSFESTFSSVGRSMTMVGAGLTAGVTLPLVGIGKQAIGTAASFEASMNILGIAASGAGTSMDDLREAALAVGADVELVGIDASESAQAMTNFYKAGLDTTEIFGDLDGYLEGTTGLMGALRSAIDLAAASDMDLNRASDAVAIAMATFGLEAEEATHVADSFVQAADASVTEVSELADALVNVGPTAASFGWSLDQTNTALALLSERGIRGAEAGTALKSMMTNMMRDTPKVTAAWNDLGVSMYNADGTMRALPEILGDLESSMAGMTQQERNMTVQTLAGTYGMKALHTLLAEGAEGWSDMESAVTAAASASESAGVRTQGFSASMEQLQGTIETLLIQVGTPLIQEFLTPLIQKVTDIIGKITEVNPSFFKWAGIIGIVVAALGPLLTILGLALTFIPALISPIGLVIAAIAALGAAWATNFMGIRDALQPVIDLFGALVSGVVGADFPWEDIFPPWLADIAYEVTDIVTGLVDVFKDMMGGVFGVDYPWEDVFPPWLADIAYALTDIFQSIVDAFKAGGGILEAFFSILVGGESAGVAFSRVFKVVSDALGPKLTGSIGTFLVWIGKIPGIIEGVVSFISGAFTGIVNIARLTWPQVKAIVETVWNGIAAAIQFVVDTVVPLVVNVWQTLVDWFNENLPRILGIVWEVWQGILNVVQFVVDTIVPFVIEQFGAIRAWVQENWPLIKATIETVLNAILNVVQGVLEAVRGFWEQHGERIMTIVTKAWDIIKTTVETVINTVLAIVRAIMLVIQGDWEGAWETIKEAAVGVWEAIKTVIGDAIAIVVETLSVIWLEVKEKIETAWEAVETKTTEVWEAARDLVIGVVTKILTKVAEVFGSDGVIATKIKEAYNKVAEWVGKIIGWFDDLLGTIGAIASAIGDVISAILRLAGVEVPDWLPGGSPPPMAVWFDAITESALGAASGIQELSDSVRSIPSSGGLRIAAQMSGGAAGGAGYGQQAEPVLGQQFINVYGGLQLSTDSERGVGGVLEELYGVSL